MVNGRWVAFASGAAGALLTLGCGPEFHLYSASTSTAQGGGGGTGPMMTSSSGEGGAPNTGCTIGAPSSCGQNSYCQRSTNKCAPCADIATQFVFGVPRKINIDLPDKGTNPRFIRIGPNGQLLFTFLTQSMNQGIGHAEPDGFLQWKESVQEPAPINSAMEELAPLYLPKGNALKEVLSNSAVVDADKEVILYTSRSSGSRQVYAFNPPGKTNSTIASVILKGGASTSNIAVSYEASTPRFWFSTNLSSTSEELYTSLPKETPQQLSIMPDNGCTAPPSGAAPWVTPDGMWLLLDVQTPNEQNNCMVDKNAPSRLYYTRLDPMTGMQLASTRATPIFPNSAKNYASPSLSPDMCVLLFSELGDQGMWESYASVRE